MFIGAFDVVQFVHDLSMTFVSGEFIFFTAILIAYYYAVRPQRQWIVILIGSLLFCLWGGWQVLAVPVLLSVIVYCSARIIETADKAEKKKRKLLAAVTIIVLIAALSIIKLTQLLHLVTARFVFPIGISYYTFSAISYLLDVYRRKDRAETNYLKLLCFLVYFPKILQGPISRHNLLAPQLFAGHKFSYQNFCFGMQLVLWGYFKKIVLADRLSVIIQTVFPNYTNYGGLLILTAAVIDAIRIYADFSGCMDMAAGISQMLGIELEQNFKQPFFSESVAEFWRNWHITLGTWFKDYVYMPLAISPKTLKIVNWFRTHVNKRAGRMVTTIIPTAVIWLLTGLWHGTGWTYVVWGVYWGTLVTLSTLFAKEFAALAKFLHIDTSAPSWKYFRIVRTFFAFCMGRLITVPGSLDASGEIIKKIFTDSRPWELVDTTLYQLSLSRLEFQLAFLCVGILWAADYLQTKYKVRESIARWNVILRSVFYSAAILFVLVFGMWGPSYSASAFAYMGF